MTRAYNDIEAVTSLLEEKERDLELAARIGQSLLERNKELEEKNSEYEVQLAEANDKIKQLRHEVSQKEALLQMYLHEEEVCTPEDERLQVNAGVANIIGLQKKVQSLEAENFRLIKQTASIKTETALQEEREQSLFRDCVKQLEDYKKQVIQLQEELLTKTDISLQQQQEITSLTERKVALEAQNKKVLGDLAELTKNLAAAHQVQRELAAEISELESKNTELEVLLREYSEEIKSLRKKQKPGFIRHHSNYNSPFLPEDSLALELQDSLRRFIDCPPGYSSEERRAHNRRALRTARAVRCASRNSRSSANSSYGNESMIGSLQGSQCVSDSEFSEAGFGDDTDSVHSSNMTLGRPCLPACGAFDLGSRHNDTDSESMSSMADMSRLAYKLPERLQLVKPIEGSHTLHQWKRLATPHLAGLLEYRPGIQTRGGVNTEDSEYDEIYSLSDYEQDDDYSLHLGKCMEHTSSVYTFTMSKVLHPNDQYNSYINRLDDDDADEDFTSTLDSSLKVTPTVSYGGKLASCGTSTFSMSAGLAMSLQERVCPEDLADTRRYSHIVSETISAPICTQSEPTDTLASCGSTSQSDSKSSVGVLSSDVSVCLTSAATWCLTTSSPDIAPWCVSEEAYLSLARKVEQVGLSTVLALASGSSSGSGLNRVVLDPTHMGLNAIMAIKRDRSGPLSRSLAYRRSDQWSARKNAPRYLSYSLPASVCNSNRSVSDSLTSNDLTSDVSARVVSESTEPDRPITEPAKRPNFLAVTPVNMTHVTTTSVSTTSVGVTSGLFRHLSNFYSKSKEMLNVADSLYKSE